MPYIAYKIATGETKRCYYRSGPIPLKDKKRTTSIKLYEWQRDRLAKAGMTPQQAIDFLCTYPEVLGNTKSA
jgi:hypothetical protein